LTQITLFYRVLFIKDCSGNSTSLSVQCQGGFLHADRVYDTHLISVSDCPAARCGGTSWLVAHKPDASGSRKRKLWAATLANSVFPGIAAAFALYFWHRTRPAYVDRYWLIYCAITLLSAIAMWYLPYSLGASETKKDEYQRLYAGTRQILPPRGNNPRPNLLHVIFHVVFVATFAIAVALSARTL
jgi:hypothetical protein